MNLFGIPIFVSQAMIIEFLTMYFPDVALAPNQLFFAFLFINFMYLWFYFKIIIPFLYKVLIFVLNHVF